MIEAEEPRWDAIARELHRSTTPDFRAIHRDLQEDEARTGRLHAIAHIGLSIREALLNDYDCWTVIFGRERSGKSTLALTINQIIDPKFTLENVVFDSETLHHRFDVADPYSALIHDEAVNGAYNRRTQSTGNVGLAELAMIAGERNNAVTMNIPDWYALDPFWRDHRPRLRLYVTTRGYCIPRYRSRSEFQREAFWSAWPWLDGFHFPELRGPFWAAYRAMKTEYVNKATKNKAAYARAKGQNASKPAQRDISAIAEEVRQDATYWTQGGRLRIRNVQSKYDLTPAQRRTLQDIIRPPRR